MKSTLDITFDMHTNFDSLKYMIKIIIFIIHFSQLFMVP